MALMIIGKEKVKLTSRETEIATMIAHGKSYKYISHACSINEDTVKFHVEGVRKKLGAKNKTHAIALALVTGIIQLELMEYRENGH
jgi:two-component system NarL family response regulator